jgi:hypothetical protein
MSDCPRRPPVGARPGDALEMRPKPIVKPLSLEARAERSLVEDRVWDSGRWVLGAEFETEPPDYRARRGSRRSTMRGHPSAQRQTDPGEPPRS